MSKNNNQVPAVEHLRRVWRENEIISSDAKAELLQLRLDQLIASIFSNGPFYFYTFDLFDLKIHNVSASIESILGLNPDKVTFQQILEQVHPDDMAFVTRAEETAIRLFQDEIGIDKILNYKISYCFRFRTRDGSYRLFNHQAVVLSTDGNGGLSKSLNIHTDISHLSTENNYKLSLIGMNGAPSYQNINIEGEFSPPVPAKSLYTEREITIIRLIATGLTSQQIAGELNLSEFTIKNHRKRIIKKSGCHNMSQVLGECITKGLI
ncbi:MULTISPECIES: LuxR C-terminal-related transcriptional regulator [Microbulbifer]|uniref:LuxR C-terminal-related transcriptional regulator n=1 Tax=Microbulbifer celer TaxID=435905 RepID=A0ABW3U9M0_9GAMM|nr:MULTISPECIES: LuxR C-terminal-related transcriptional regulator [Microbulbifer]UFN57217.1 LuxR C-terminal-related transcriptional regulator [Microbulbifer celer]